MTARRPPASDRRRIGPAGQLRHKDSLGSEQVLRPGQLTLMTAGHGVVHSEESTGSYRGTLEGIQLWIAQPDATREGGAGFAHHDGLPRLDVAGGSLTVLRGTYQGAASPAVTAHPAIGMELDLTLPTTIPLDPQFEHALIPLRGRVGVLGEQIGPGQIGPGQIGPGQIGPGQIGPGQSAYLPAGRSEVTLHPEGASTVMLIGGLPFGEVPVMWWNFVGRTREEIVDAYRAWQADDRERFGAVTSRLRRIETSAPPWT